MEGGRLTDKLCNLQCFYLYHTAAVGPTSDQLVLDLGTKEYRAAQIIQAAQRWQTLAHIYC